MNVPVEVQVNVISVKKNSLRRKLILKNIERGRNHLIVKRMINTEEGPRKLPVLYIVQSDDQGVRAEPFDSLLEYYEDRSSMSYQWMKNVARGLGLLIDFGMATASSGWYEKWAAEGKLYRRLFRGLAKALIRGTATLDESGRLKDPTSLYWSPLGPDQTGVLLSSLTWYFRWMGEDDANSRWAAAGSTDGIAKHPLVALRLAAELQIRNETSLLAHTKGFKKKSPSHPHLLVTGMAKSAESAVPTFPARHVMTFLQKGFVDLAGNRNDEAELVAHLTFGLGIRESEAFHLFVSDVQFVEGFPWVFFHHPSAGRVSDSGRGLITRKEYLQKFGLLPRNEDEGRNKAGWKGMHGDGDGTPGFWLPINPIRNRAAELLKRYLFVKRPGIMAARPRSAGDHPFLLVTPRRLGGWNTGEIGDPYTIEAYEGAWETAVRRIGQLSDDPVMMKMEKARGNTPHGSRHFYGKFLYSAGVDGTVIQRCMHHRSLLAHQAYTRLTDSEVNDILHRASRGVDASAPFKDLGKEFMSQFDDIPAAA